MSFFTIIHLGKKCEIKGVFTWSPVYRLGEITHLDEINHVRVYMTVK